MTMLNSAHAIEAKISSDFGSVMRLLTKTERRLFKIASIEVQIMPAIKLQQIYIAHDKRGNLAGYVTWAFVTDAVANELKSDENRLLHASEWNEGLNLWIVDFVALEGHVRSIASFLRQNLLNDFNRVQSIRDLRRRKGRRNINLSRSKLK